MHMLTWQVLVEVQVFTGQHMCAQAMRMPTGQRAARIVHWPARAHIPTHTCTCLHMRPRMHTGVHGTA